MLHFFGNGIERFYVDMACGLKKDKEIKTEKIYLYRYNNMYFPENNYFNSDPLPIEWLELFEDSEFFQEEFRIEEDENDRLAFTPFCSKKELNYLEQDFKGRWNVRKEALISSGNQNLNSIVSNVTDRLYPRYNSTGRAQTARSKLTQN